ncbi:MAG: peptidoglycan-binding protein [Patescibacteria group bacterium]
MSIATNNVIAKIAAVVAGLGLVAMSFAYAAPAVKAQATSDLNAQIAALMAQIQALQAQAGGSASASMTFSKDLTLGSSGADVTALQNWLISKGHAIAAGATGYFGAQTKAALSAYQASAGITPAAGYFGPITRAKVNAAGGVSTTPGTTPVTGLTGLGRLTNVSSLGDTTSDLKEGGAIAQVVGASALATDGDVAIQRVDAEFTVDGTTGSANLNKYVTDVSIYLDGKKLASMDATAGDKNGRVWTFRFAGLNGIIKKGQTGNLYVKVTPVSTVDSNEAGVNVQADLAVNSIRAVGSDGISETYVATRIDSSFTVGSMTAGTLTVSAGSDNPKASQVAVASSTTEGVKLLTFTLKAKNQAITVSDLVASFGTSDNNLSDVVSTVKLMKGTTVLKSKTLSTGTYGTVTFDNVDFTIAKDSTESYWISADLKGDSAYADGTTLIASTTTASWDVADADGATVTPSAAAVGNTMTLTATGVSVVKGTVTTSTTVGLTGAGDTTQYAIPFTVTAGDSDVFIGAAVQRLASASTAPSASAGGVAFATTTSSTASSTYSATTNFSASDVVTGDVSGTAFKIPANTSRTFTLNVAFTAASTGYTGVVLTGINYGASSTLGTTYYTSNLDTFKTADVLMKLR